LEAGIISHAALAEYLEEDITKELGKPVKLPAIVMAIRRYNEEIYSKKKLETNFKFNSELIMKSNLVDITIARSRSSIPKLKKIYDLVNYYRGDTLNIIHGNYEITIVASGKYLSKIKKLMIDEKILNIEENLVSLSLSFSEDFLHTPGIISKVTQKLFWENINIYENISTMTELIFVISKEKSLEGYKVLKNIIEESS